MLLHSTPPDPVLVIMGVSGAGRSTVAGLLAGALGWDLAEGDDMHPAANIEKMAAGHPLDDADRWPWLARVAEWIRARTAADRPGIVTSSALNRSYRDVLRGPSVVFVYLAGSRALIARRLAARQGHFMPAELLDSQFVTLEPPGPDEQAITVDITGSPSTEAAQILQMLQSAGPSGAGDAMTGDPAIARAVVGTSGSQRTGQFAVTGSLVMVGSIASAQLANGSMRGEGDR
jgi:carbohydrate kinase (thermoresistant glucokinase family)